MWPFKKKYVLYITEDKTLLRIAQIVKSVRHRDMCDILLPSVLDGYVVNVTGRIEFIKPEQVILFGESFDDLYGAGIFLRSILDRIGKATCKCEGKCHGKAHS